MVLTLLFGSRSFLILKKTLPFDSTIIQRNAFCVKDIVN